MSFGKRAGPSTPYQPITSKPGNTSAIVGRSGNTPTRLGVVTANARAWRTMLELRSSEGAEQEIRRLSLMVLRTLQAEAPGFFADFEVYTAEDRVDAARISYHKV